MKAKPVLAVRNLSISFGGNQVIHDISYDLYENEILGVVGESGSGKSVSALAVLGLLPKRISKITRGSIEFQGQDLITMPASQIREIRGKQIAMIFQEPMSSLNPSITCGSQVQDVLMRHMGMGPNAAKDEVISLFEQVKLPDPETTYSKYPHQISGGQMQRVMIAMAVACKPQVLIADEPTTALDVTVQKEIIILLKALQSRHRMSIIFISHDLSLISEIADRVAVMYQGKIVEQGTSLDIFKKPQHAYTKALINSRPSLDTRLKVLPTIRDYLEDRVSLDEVSAQERRERHEHLYSKPPLLEVINLEKVYFSRSGIFSKPDEFKAVDKVSFKLYEGETLGLVGESGCGKSTLGNAILQLDKATAGTILYRGKDITRLSGSEIKALRKEIQIIFQDPYASLNPRIAIGRSITEPMKVHGLYNSDAERREKALELLERVGLEPEHYNRYPHQFSGGQRQRIGIARAIALQPKLIVCDESVSALDISVQAQVLNLLNELKENFGFTYIFISHDLAVVKFMSDQLLVMNQGQIEELGDADAIYNDPERPYTKRLIDAIPKGI